MNQCIFCKSRTNEFTQTEHLIPESLGGDQVLPPGFVCDPCNGYFGREVERRALDTPILSFLRTSLCIPNKKGDQRHYEGFRFEVFGQDSGESFVVFPPKKLQYVLEHGEGQMLIPITGLGAIARLMLKMGLECIALDQQCDIFDPIFDDARVAARAPKPNMTWPLAYGRLRLEDTVVEVQEDDEGLTIEELVYDYTLLFDRELGLRLFSFTYNWATFLVPVQMGDFAKVVYQTNSLNPPECQLSIVQADLLRDI